MDGKATFESKRDPALMAILLLSVGSVWFMCLRDARTPLATAIVLPIAVLSTALILPMVILCRYTFVGDQLVVRSGLFYRRSIGIADVREVVPDRSAESSPAMSLDRLRVAYTDGREPKSLLLSPRDKAGFLKVLAERRPDLVLDVQSLIARIATV